MAKTNIEEQPRELTQVCMDLFVDQVHTLKEVEKKTGKKRAQLIRQAIDDAYPRKK